MSWLRTSDSRRVSARALSQVTASDCHGTDHPDEMCRSGRWLRRPEFRSLQLAPVWVGRSGDRRFAPLLPKQEPKPNTKPQETTRWIELSIATQILLSNTHMRVSALILRIVVPPSRRRFAKPFALILLEVRRSVILLRVAPLLLFR